MVERLYAVHVRIERETILFLRAESPEDARIRAQNKPFVVEAGLGEEVPR